MSVELPQVVVVGGGVSGLAAAWFLTRGNKGPRARVTVLDADQRVGGKLRTEWLGDLPIDVGAEAILATRPEAVTVCRDLGLDVQPAATTTTAIYSRGRMRAMPGQTLTGVPADLRRLAASGIVSVPGLLRIPLDHLLPRTVLHGDISVGDYVSARLGTEVVDRLVEPVLGGVYAGRAEDLSLQTTVPALYRAAATRRSAVEAVRSVLADGRKTTGPRRGPVFVGIEAGAGRLAQELATALQERGVTVRTGAAVNGLQPRASGWDVYWGEDIETADAVIFATPAHVTGRLLHSVNEPAAHELSGIEYADVAVVTLAYRATDAAGLTGSGFLVPPVEGYAVTSVTFSSRKWSWIGARAEESEGWFLLRACVGRAGDPLVSGTSDRELVERAAHEVAAMTGLPAHPVADQLTRWEQGLPQYTVGHRARVAEAREWLQSTPGLALCGAAYEGVGVPACIGSAQAAVSGLVQQWSAR